MTAAVAAPGDPAASGAHRFTVNSRDMLNGRREVAIRHRPLEHRLRITRAGKLVLTK